MDMFSSTDWDAWIFIMAEWIGSGTSWLDCRWNLNLNFQSRMRSWINLLGGLPGGGWKQEWLAAVTVTVGFFCSGRSCDMDGDMSLIIMSYERSHDISGNGLHIGNGVPIPKRFFFNFHECLKGKKVGSRTAVLLTLADCVSSPLLSRILIIRIIPTRGTEESDFQMIILSNCIHPRSLI